MSSPHKLFGIASQNFLSEYSQVRMTFPQSLSKIKVPKEKVVSLKEC